MPHDPLKALKKATSIGPAKPRIPLQMEEPPVFDEPEPLARFGDIGELIREGIGSSPIGGLISLLVGGGAATPPKRFPKFILPDGKVLDYTPAKVVREFAGNKVVDTTTQHGRMLEGKEAQRALTAKPRSWGWGKPDPTSTSHRLKSENPATVSSVDELSDLAIKPAVTGQLSNPKPITGSHGSGGRARAGKSRLSEADIKDIRKRSAAGESNKDIAAAYGIKPNTAGQIARREMWSWIKDE